MTELLRQARGRIKKADRITVLTGAGISADSGVPTFRGPGWASGSAGDRPGRGGIGGSASGGPHGPPHTIGLWRNFRAEDLATPEAFRRDPALVWEWYNWRRELIATKKPNPAHTVLATLEKSCPTFRLITQNVDGLHGQAGSRNLIELHGNIWKVRCTGCGKVSEDRRVPIPIPPVCGSCGKMLRPHIVWFGESLDPDDMDRSIAALEDCEVMLVIGTSGVVQPAASFATAARSAGAFVIEVNPEAGSPAAHVALRGRAADVVPRLVDVK